MVDKIVKPILEQKTSHPTPSDRRRFPRVVVGEIIVRHFNIHTFFQIPEIFLCKRIAVILGMSRAEEVSARHIGDEMHARFVGIGQNLQILDLGNILSASFGMP